MPPRASGAADARHFFLTMDSRSLSHSCPIYFFRCPDQTSASTRAHHCLCYPLFHSLCVIVFYVSGNRCGAADGHLTPFMTPFEEHNKEYSDRSARCSMLRIAITDTRRIRLFAGGFPGTRGASLAFCARSCCTSMEDLDAPLRPMLNGDFILRDSGFALTTFLVRCRTTFHQTFSTPPPAPPPAPFCGTCQALAAIALPHPINRRPRVERELRDGSLSLPPVQDKNFDSQFIGQLFFLASVCFFLCASHALYITLFREAGLHGRNVSSMRRFNHQHAKMVVVVENAFGRLKGGWNVLRMICVHPTLASFIQEVAAALHNFLEARDGAYDENVEEETDRPEGMGNAVEGGESTFSLGSQRRITILKALGLPRVDED